MAIVAMILGIISLVTFLILLSPLPLAVPLYGIVTILQEVYLGNKCTYCYMWDKKVELLLLT